jgi:hypothetical protein
LCINWTTVPIKRKLLAIKGGLINATDNPPHDIQWFAFGLFRQRCAERIGSVARPAPVQRIQSQAPPQSNGMTAAPGAKPVPPSVQPGQVLPRGSLLDLSV